MNHWGLLLTVTALCACVSTQSGPGDARELSLQVAGFVQAEGIT